MPAYRWNPAVESQAIDRVYRIGQTKPVTVHRLLIKDTIEQKILRIQEEKNRIVATAFGGDAKSGRLDLEDLKDLFGYREEENEGDEKRGEERE